MRNVGRPKKENTKRDGYRLRLDEEMRMELEYLVEKTGKSRADILRAGIELLYKEVQNGSSEEK